jgi:EAL domain-containing protein (putative c-di-GMP-specific phosphodiesterase class I)/DNA-binding NarL/FixJ family response regulator
MNHPQSTLRALAVDDETFQLKLISRQLAKLGIADTRTCDSAAAALSLLRSEPGSFDLICCDLQMPHMDGVEFLRHLGEMQFKGALVLISGEDERILRTAERLAKAHGLQVVGALHKPVSPEQLARAVDAAGQSSPQRSRNPGGQRIYTGDEVAAAIDGGQLVNWYQPTVELSTGRVRGVECLVRWQHPEDGLVMPDRFIGVAEHNGLIDALTRAVLESALQQARYWQDAGLPLQVSVNVSMDNLTDHAFPQQVSAALERAGLPASRLVLEVTETRLMRDPLATLDILTRLRLKRVSLSIDDFGTGHSSLSQLRDVPFDELKVDRGFVDGASQNAELRTLLLASLDLASQLGLRTVAEGVEKIADWKLLQAHNCDLAQGYFIGRPMPCAALPAWMADWEQRHPALASSLTNIGAT